MNDNVLDKIRKLLALAERAGTAAEAEQATAAAERLIIKHAVDTAVLDQARQDEGCQPVVKTTALIRGSYLAPRALLLGVVAKANGVRVVRHADTRVSMVGYESDIATVELLYGSLSVQATNAMLSAVCPDPGRTRSFRHAFLLAFANAVHLRLLAAKRQAVESTPGSALVLRSRSAEVDTASQRAFPHARLSQTSSSNTAGTQAGRAAGQRADLGHKRFASARTVQSQS